MQRSVPYGTIASWHGTIATIPSTWRLCNGTQKTPDLRDKFIVGAGDTYGPGAQGGNVNHNHIFTGNGHNHSLQGGTDIGYAFTGRLATDVKQLTGTTNNKDGRPPYYSLAFIMYKGVPA